MEMGHRLRPGPRRRMAGMGRPPGGPRRPQQDRAGAPSTASAWPGCPSQHLADPPHRGEPRQLAHPTLPREGRPPQPHRPLPAPRHLGRDRAEDPVGPEGRPGLPLLYPHLSGLGLGPDAPAGGGPEECLDQGPDRGRG
eukprot:15454443-Alexandrium_andersonii.AAC.1